MFKPVSNRVSFPDLDVNVLQQWKEKDVFRRTESERPDAPLFMMYEGPPTANGSPGIHHVLARVFKDVICRYRTMKGYRVPRKGGWDTHGLPVELEVEKELGLKSKRDIEEYGIEEFNKKCRESVFRYVKEWETMTDRIGYWVDMEDPYVTLHNNYIETGWWMLKTLWDKDLLYQTMRGTPHCPRCVTSLSSHEVALGYRENTPDPSVFIKFKVDPAASTDKSDVLEKLGAGNTDVFLLAWTTTPWTLPGNTGLAVDENADYSIVELEGEGGSHRLVLAQALVSVNVTQEHKIVGTVKGSDLVGLGYTPLYHPQEFGSQVRRFVRRPGPGGMVTELEDTTEFAPTTISADFVSLDDGTGIVHIAPAFGDEDLGVGREKELAFVQPVDLQGIITGNYRFAGKFVKSADKEIMEDLTERSLLFHHDIYRHTYPFCWRCDTPLLYYAKSSWYIRTSALKDDLVGGNDIINWYPDYIKDGRFGEWLRNNVDWAISRERYWGTPIPIWRCEECNHTICIGGVDELRGMAGTNGSLNADGLDLHRPYVDNIILDCTAEGCTGKMHRIPEVMDAWFDSGAMPFAQFHYPFENDSIDQDGRFPADYICEAVDQTRGWFYSLHALSTLLKGQPAYKNVICLGLILDEKGRKMSKRVGNVVEPLSVLDEHGADALRWYLFTASHPGEPRRFSGKLVSETLRKVMLTLWNVYSFFIGYAEIDKFDPSQTPADWKPENELDRWVLSELNTLIAQVDGYMDGYEPTNAGRRIQEFIDQLSNWYVRRSRRRFWRNEGDADKLSGYITLHTCLVTVAKLMAPLAPFVAEEMYLNLVCSVDPSAPDSIHLSDYPVADESLVDQPLMAATQLAMKVASMGRAARSKAGLKVRQPLANVLVKIRVSEEREYIDQVRPQVLEELNIKDIQVIEDDAPLVRQVLDEAGDQTETILSVENYSVSMEGGYMVAVDGDLSDALKEEGLAREVVHRIQGMRRSANFDVTDRIVTYYQGPSEFAGIMQGAFSDYIRNETLSNDLVDGSPSTESATESTKIEGMEITLAVHQA
ncbi:MAG: isoleucine--tRNA ligase [Chloroflexi bacterium]|jgi:isoleucyl-tRNA synthetase|nr:isoleucine--tRNA ligase [Chloroflexota bacterium]MDP6498392.1 isoleucine--tRNA ligase [Dehalococcoidia bacterium]MQG55032.1 isoleucine--tRNA ligase [SAR202 cluster bacterium]|tara:strand:+ start:21598 stop:24738 length:3141 start_codon:yes stop_codon:yes gene_type:complete